MVASLSDENIKLQERITTLEATTDQRIKDLENKNQELQSMNDSLVGNYNDRSSKEEELQQTITVLEEKQKAAQKEKETLRSSIKSYRRWTHQMRELLSQLDGVDEYEDTVDDDDDDQVEPLPKRQKR
jgi:chromosome segregation ATPase